MARNAEKAMTTLARWRQAQIDATKGDERRPYLASLCDELPKAEKWRREIIGEISKKVAQIQNAGLGEFRIRDLNDEINKLLREKRHWERRILELNGPNFLRFGPRMIDQDGKEVPGNRGYKYFGAAKELPGVRELFEREPPPPPRKTRAELMKDCDADYYGYRDDDDGILIPLEQEVEKQAKAKAMAEWKEMKLQKSQTKDEEQDIYAIPKEGSEDEEDMDITNSAKSNEKRFIAHVPVPSQKEIEEALLKRKKLELLEKYASDSMRKQSQDAQTLIGL